MIKFNISSVVFLCFLLILSSCSSFQKKPDFEALYGKTSPQKRVLTATEIESRPSDAISYYQEVKPILDSRCIMCHGCYDAPCQLKLTSFEGLERGASKKKVYHAELFKPSSPSRLFIDAQKIREWREKNFHPVINERSHTAVANLDHSVFAKLLQLKRRHPLVANEKLPKTFDLSLDRQQECPTMDEFDQYQQQHASWGMPYAMPALSLKAEYTLLQWLEEGAKIEPRSPLSQKATLEIARWETFFNQPSLKNQLVSRYLYEHLFIGHLHFQGHPETEFYKLVRSTTPSRQPIQEIATVRPYEDPNVERVYYRLRSIVATIVDKTHFVYELSEQKRQRYEELFFQPTYSVTKLPSYQTESASNPFKTFKDIPISSRYKFLLDNAEYFVSGFIKGPVCRGQVALNVIRDRFWVVFAKPEMNYVQQGVKFLAENTPTLALPGEAGDQIGLFDWRVYDRFGEQYLEKKEAFINQILLKKQRLDLSFIWKGGQEKNDNAALTIFRHVDSATVVKGLVGQTPLTAWVLDYPIFERIHYLLVAGFNVYGSVGHQLASRKYMNYLRIDGENNFLRFMPKKQRLQLHQSWYKGLESKLMTVPLLSLDYESGVRYQTTAYRQEFFDQLSDQHQINRCPQGLCLKNNDPLLQQLASLQGEQLALLPEVSFMRVKTHDANEDRVYSLLINRAYSNIAFMIADNYRREPWNDTLTVVPGFIGSYPNFFFTLKHHQLKIFIQHLKTARTDTEKDSFFKNYGIRRSNPAIWGAYDWFNQHYQKNRGKFSGKFDMSRYQNL